MKLPIPALLTEFVSNGVLATPVDQNHQNLMHAKRIESSALSLQDYDALELRGRLLRMSNHIFCVCFDKIPVHEKYVNFNILECLLFEPIKYKILTKRLEFAER